MPTLILVHIGNDFFDYINDCIAQIQATTTIDIHLLISNENIYKVKGKAEIFPLENIPMSDKRKEFESSSRLNAYFRNGFWKYAMLRFLYIYDHVISKKLCDIFHIENDILIYRDFLKQLESFQKKQMWCVLDSIESRRCIPSFLYFKDIVILSRLVDKCVESAKISLDDMRALGDFALKNPDDVGILPIVRDYIDPIDPLFYQYADMFGCVFDGAAVGQYIGGVDPRNDSGDTIGFINETTVIKCNRMKIEWRNKRPFLNDVPLVNLHIHSKDLKRWANYTNTIITGERIQELCDVYLGFPDDFRYNPRIFSQTAKHVDINSIVSKWNNPKIIFCYSHCLESFRGIVQYIQNEFILVSHNSDHTVTEEFLDILNTPLLISWHAQNVLYNHNKLFFLPIGIANSMWPHGDIFALERTRNKNISKTKNFYFYFSIYTNYQHRSECKNKLEKKGLLFGNNDPNFESYLEDLATYKYAICPPGNGVDCHRIWECLYLNVIPIVLRSVFTEKISKEYHCILLDDWDNFEPDSLIQNYTMVYYTKLSINDIHL